MQEIDEGLWHWTATHPRISWEVSSYYLSDEQVLIDPVLPPGGLDWFGEIDSTPAHVLLSCRHHDRSSWQVVEAFGVEVHCVDTGVCDSLLLAHGEPILTGGKQALAAFIGE